MPATTIKDILNSSKDRQLPLFKEFLRNNPSYLTSEDNYGDNPLFAAIRTGDLSLLKLLLCAGVDINHPNRFGNSPLRLATKHGKKDIAKHLVLNGANVAKELDYKTAISADRSWLALRFFGAWLLSAIILFAVAVGLSALITYNISFVPTGGHSYYGMLSRPIMVLSSSLFMSAFLTSLWISAIVAVVIGLVIASICLYKHVQDNYKAVPEYLQTKRTELLQAINNNNTNLIREIIIENNTWMLAPISYTYKNTIELLRTMDNGGEILDELIPLVINNKVFVSQLLNANSLTPEVFWTVANYMPVEIITQHKEQLRERFTKDVQFFKENIAQYPSIIAKFTVVRQCLEDIEPTHYKFIVDALNRDNSSWGQIAKGHVNIAGMYGEQQDFAKAIEAFSSVDNQEPELYIEAQANLGDLNYIKCADYEDKSKEWLQCYFLALNNYNNACTLDVSSNGRAKLHQENCRDWLEDLKDDAPTIFNYLEETDLIDTEIITGKTYREIGAESGYCDLVNNTSIASTNEKLNIDLLIELSQSNYFNAERLLSSGAKVDANITTHTTHNNALHEVARNNKYNLLRKMLITQDGLTSLNKDGLTPIEIAANAGHWECVLEIVNKYPQTNYKDKTMGSLLYLAVQDKQHHIVETLMRKTSIKDSDGFYASDTGYSPLHLAIKNKDINSIDKLLQSDKDVGHIDLEGNTPIVLAAKLGHWDVVEKIALQFTTDAHDSFQYCQTLYLVMESEKNYYLCDLLVNKGALRGNYASNKKGDSVWHKVMGCNNLQLLQHMLEKSTPENRRLYVKNFYGITPMNLAVKKKEFLDFIISNYYPFPTALALSELGFLSSGEGDYNLENKILSPGYLKP